MIKSNLQNLKKILRKSRGSISKIKCFYRQKNRYFVVIAFKMLKMEFKFKYTILLTIVINHSSQFLSEKVKKNFRKFEAQFREKLRKLRLRQNNDFLIKKNVYLTLCRASILLNSSGFEPKIILKLFLNII